MFRFLFRSLSALRPQARPRARRRNRDWRRWKTASHPLLSCVRRTETSTPFRAQATLRSCARENRPPPSHPPPQANPIGSRPPRIAITAIPPPLPMTSCFRSCTAARATFPPPIPRTSCIRTCKRAATWFGSPRSMRPRRQRTIVRRLPHARRISRGAETGGTGDAATGGETSLETFPLGHDPSSEQDEPSAPLRFGADGDIPRDGYTTVRGYGHSSSERLSTRIEVRRCGRRSSRRVTVAAVRSASSISSTSSSPGLVLRRSRSRHARIGPSE